MVKISKGMSLSFNSSTLGAADFAGKGFSDVKSRLYASPESDFSDDAMQTARRIECNAPKPNERPDFSVLRKPYNPSDELSKGVKLPPYILKAKDTRPKYDLVSRVNSEKFAGQKQAFTYGFGRQELSGSYGFGRQALEQGYRQTRQEPGKYLEPVKVCENLKPQDKKSYKNPPGDYENPGKDYKKPSDSYDNSKGYSN